MATYSDLISQCKQMLQGYTRNQEQITWLSEPMTSTDTTFMVDPSTAGLVSRGLVEIDDELLLVNRFNSLTGEITVAAGTNGRGREGTSAANHAVNSIITMDPDYPISRIKESINYSINAVYPDLFVFKSHEFPYRAARYEYPLPADAEDVIRVTADTIGPSKVKFPNVTWRFNPQAQNDAASGLTTGRTIQIYDRIVPGRTIRVMYLTKPSLLVNPNDDYETTTGLPDRTQDVIMYGAVARMLAGTESARLQQKSVESTERAPLVPTGSATNTSNYFWQLYYRRLNEEIDRLHQLVPSFQTFNG